MSTLLVKWLTALLMLANLALFLSAAHRYYLSAISLRHFHGYKAFFYFNLLVIFRMSPNSPQPPIILILALLFCFLKDLYLFLQPLSQDQKWN